jgi:hypothetical protein
VSALKHWQIFVLLGLWVDAIIWTITGVVLQMTIVDGVNKFRRAADQIPVFKTTLNDFERAMLFRNSPFRTYPEYRRYYPGSRLPLWAVISLIVVLCSGGLLFFLTQRWNIF